LGGHNKIWRCDGCSRRSVSSKFIVTKELDKGFVNWGYCKTWIKSEKRQWGRGDAKAWGDGRNFPNVLMR
jgi:hypothetical protein